MTTGRAAFHVSALLLLLLVPLAGCDWNKGTKVEVLSGSSPGKKLIRVAASDEVYIHFQKVAETYSSQHEVQFEISQTQGIHIPGLVEKGTVDLGVTARRLTPKERGPGISYIPYAYDGAVFLASPDAKVRSLTLAQVRQILSGKIVNWKEVGGADKEIRVIERPQYSAVRISVGNALFDGEYPKSKSSLTLETSENTYQALKSLSSYLAYAPISRISVEQFPSVPLSIDGMLPLITNVPSMKYPATLEYSILFSSKDSPEAVVNFADYLGSVDGMHHLASLGLVPAAGKLSLTSCHCRATEGTFTPARKSPMAGNFTIAVVPELGAIEQERRYSGISRFIAEELGVKTQLKHVESYGRVVREFEEGRIDAAFVGSLVYGQLHDRLGVIALVRPEAGKVSFYQGIVIVRAGSRIGKFSDLRGKAFAYVPNTSAGELFTSALLRKNGAATEESFFSRVVRVSSHADAVQLVATGKVDGAAVKDLVFKRMLKERKVTGSGEPDGKIHLLEASPFFPENSLVVSPLLDVKQRGKLRDILLACDKKDMGKAALAVLGADRFIPTAHEDYSKMYLLAQESGYSFRKK
jgi:phosphate/phosphite/phosphonate ABC transporter binding protein